MVVQPLQRQGQQGQGRRLHPGMGARDPGPAHQVGVVPDDRSALGGVGSRRPAPLVQQPGGSPAAARSRACPGRSRAAWQAAWASRVRAPPARRRASRRASASPASQSAPRTIAPGSPARGERPRQLQRPRQARAVASTLGPRSVRYPQAPEGRHSSRSSPRASSIQPLMTASWSLERCRPCDPTRASARPADCHGGRFCFKHRTCRAGASRVAGRVSLRGSTVEGRGPSFV